ncbi:MAG TPA: competence/damage-inducible protein A [Chthoniobacterales bacterium]|jgi:nicotinamide-nucleotide amidase|nr:competence/damage-inducible protein A [Chthoniobacterales bacterium]
MSAAWPVEVINTGTELLFGSVVNTHLAYLGQQLFSLGLRVDRQTTVPDGLAIADAIRAATSRSRLVIVTGGLGPTSDDVTREVVAELTGRRLQFDESVFSKIEAHVLKRGFHLSDAIKRQAYILEGATILPNDFGTAPGLYLPSAAAFPDLLMLPGPPRELRPMFQAYATPIIRKIVGHSDLRAMVFRTSGIGESAIQELVGADLDTIPAVEVGYCAHVGAVDLRLIGTGSAVEQGATIVRNELESYIVSTDGKALEEIVVELLSKRNETLAVAESCTGGYLANTITDVSGSSAVFLEGNVTYSNEAKIRTLNIPQLLIQRLGAVSEEVAGAMAEGARTRSGATYALSTTGVAGPTGGTEEKPVGTVFIGFASAMGSTEVQKLFYPTDRLTFKQVVTQRALDLLRRKLSFSP